MGRYGSEGGGWDGKLVSAPILQMKGLYDNTLYSVQDMQIS